MVRMSVRQLGRAAEGAAIDEIDIKVSIVVVVEKEATDPIVSGRYFCSDAPLMCLKWMPCLLRLVCEVECCFSHGRYHDTTDEHQVDE